MREAVDQEKESNEESNSVCLDFLSAKQKILSSYFQMVNLMMLQRINGDSGESKESSLDGNFWIMVSTAFGLQNKNVFGDIR